MKTLIQDEGMRDPKLGDNVFLDKLLSIHISDVRQWFSFDPFGEIICADQQISLVTYYFGKRANNIQALLCKRPRTGWGIKDSSWLVYVWCESLALIVLFHILLCFLLHVWLPIALCDSFMGQRSSSYVVSTNPFM